MRRSLLLLVGICAITYLEFSFYPGHTYLAGDSQPLVAMMERLQAPGFLSRDLAAINPNLTYTIYDEVTLFLCRVTTHDVEWVLSAQQLVFRFAGVLGVVLLCLATRIDSLPALGVAALASAGATLPGIHMTITDPEPVPFGFALALTTLAFGLLASFKPLLAGLMGGIALAYQPSVASLFWVFVITAFLFRRELRPVLRPTFPALIVFGLLLANAAQLQSGLGETHPLLRSIPGEWMRLQLYRTPEFWLSTWSATTFLFYFGIAALSGFALRCIWPELNALTRHIFVVLIGFGLLTLPSTFVGVQVLRSAILGEAQLLRALTLLFLAALVLWSAAAMKCWRENHRIRAILWLSPLLTAISIFRLPLRSESQKSESNSIRKIAAWADRNTWGGSMFAFPDAGKSPIPGEFRGFAMRALYSDWVSGNLVDVFPNFGNEWYRRWIQTGTPRYSVGRLQETLALPVEYVVLRRGNSLADIKPEIITSDFVVYDAHLLQNAKHPLRKLH